MTTHLEDLEDLAAVVLVPTETFREVLLSADPSLHGELEDYFEHSDSQTVVLLPLPEDDAELEQFLLPHKKALAEKEISHWIEDKSRWPKIDANLFDQWFETRFHSVVVAVGEEE
jgi:hypothetical protein